VSLQLLYQTRCQRAIQQNGKALKGRRPPFGGKGGGERKGGEGGRDLPPGGPCAQRIPSPPSSPPWVPGTRPEIPLFVFFLLFLSLLFRLNLSSAARLLSGLFPLFLSLCNVLLLQPLAFLKCSIL